MKKIALLLLLFVFYTSAFSQTNNLLSGRYDENKLKELLIPYSEWTPFPKITDRAAWAKASQPMMKAYLQEAEGYLHYKWASIPATTSLLIERTGDRNEFQSISFPKRQVLGTLVMAEVYENKGRFIDDIINGVWSICEESWWGASAHLPKSKEYSGLMDVSKPFVELFGAETATFLSWVDYFVGDQLDAVSPQVRKRIYYEINNRIFQPLMKQPHGWMTANANGRPPNNWNPWICSNWLNAALLVEKDQQKRVAMVAKLLQVLDQFVNPYPLDGGCDEGPGYWGAAAASLYDNIAMLNLATKNSFQYVFQEEKIKNMARFIYRAQIGKEYFLDFADADPQPGMAASMIWRFGKDINDEDMMKFGAFYRKPETGKIGVHQYFRNLFELFIQDEYQHAPQGLPLPSDVWLPGIQVMIARDKQGSTDGFFVAAKGGHNDESHNHNDVGNYIVYYNGQPLIIDVGRGTYTAKTFSSRRYDIWYNCSDYHNLPTINGATEPPGPIFKASDVNYKKDKSVAALSLNIAHAYPAAAGVSSWQRQVQLNRGRNVTITDVLQLQKADTIVQHMMTCYPSAVTKPGELTIHFAPKYGVAARDFVVAYNPAQLSVSIEKVPLTSMEDKGILDKWGDTIYRINFKAIAPKANDKMKFVVTAK
ncbi:MAG TPA: heparinase II/III family protein [Chitinophagaceae bacterium]|nr:heparinase II/III family protein [Chitinophagaceae bacterium]